MATRDKETEQEQGEASYKVTDRRLFTAEGELRAEAVEDDDDEREEAVPASGPAAGPQAGASAARGFERRPVQEPEGVDFTMLINAMAEPALLFLGDIAHPATGQPQVDLERARIQIDMLDLLRAKTRGNLTAEEEEWFDRILYQLRMLYVSRAHQPETR